MLYLRFLSYIDDRFVKLVHYCTVTFILHVITTSNPSRTVSFFICRLECLYRHSVLQKDCSLLYMYIVYKYEYSDDGDNNSHTNSRYLPNTYENAMGINKIYYFH